MNGTTPSIESKRTLPTMRITVGTETPWPTALTMTMAEVTRAGAVANNGHHADGPIDAHPLVGQRDTKPVVEDPRQHLHVGRHGRSTLGSARPPSRPRGNDLVGLDHLVFTCGHPIIVVHVAWTARPRLSPGTSDGHGPRGTATGCDERRPSATDQPHGEEQQPHATDHPAPRIDTPNHLIGRPPGQRPGRDPPEEVGPRSGVRDEPPSQRCGQEDPQRRVGRPGRS